MFEFPFIYFLMSGNFLESFFVHFLMSRNFFLEYFAKLAELRDATTHAGRTALHVAAAAGCEEAAQLLVEAGASLTAVDKSQRTPAALARQEVCDSV